MKSALNGGTWFRTPAVLQLCCGSSPQACHSFETFCLIANHEFDWAALWATKIIPVLHNFYRIFEIFSKEQGRFTESCWIMLTAKKPLCHNLNHAVCFISSTPMVSKLALRWMTMCLKLPLYKIWMQNVQTEDICFSKISTKQRVLSCVPPCPVLDTGSLPPHRLFSPSLLCLLLSLYLSS